MPSKQPLSEAPARRWMALPAWLRANLVANVVISSEEARNCLSTEEITTSSCLNSLLTQCNEMNATLTSYFVYFIDLLRELLALDLNLRCGW